MECAVMISLIIGSSVAILISLALYAISPYNGQRFRGKVHKNSSSFRSNCWDYSVETLSDFLAAVLTNPKVEVLIVSAITKAIDLWVSKNSENVKSIVKIKAMALPAQAMDNAMSVPTKAKGKVREQVDRIKRISTHTSKDQ